MHKQHHTAVFIDCWNQKLGEIKFDNKPSAFPLLEKEVKKHTKKGLSVVYGLEDVRGSYLPVKMILIGNRMKLKKLI
ncbi:hypothetical protein [Paenibacillus elgii]|uniref:hypothetical protein n=1 Tax=Paenibacillus elgii TaxID=189691 RepID=UPI0039F5FA7A